MASHLETTDVPLLYSPQYVTVRGCVTTVDPYVQSRLSSEYWDGPASSHTQHRARGLGQTLRPALGAKDPTPQMSSGRSRTPKQETSSLQKRLFTGMDGRGVCGHVRPSSSCGHLTKSMENCYYGNICIPSKDTEELIFDQLCYNGEKYGKLLF